MHWFCLFLSNIECDESIAKALFATNSFAGFGEEIVAEYLFAVDSCIVSRTGRILFFFSVAVCLTPHNDEPINIQIPESGCNHPVS